MYCCGYFVYNHSIVVVVEFVVVSAVVVVVVVLVQFSMKWYGSFTSIL